MKKDNELINLVILIPLCIADAFVVKYGWNHIITTILHVEKISMWQAFGLEALVSYVFPTEKSDEKYSDRILRCVARMIVYGLLIWLASTFI